MQRTIQTFVVFLALSACDPYDRIIVANPPDSPERVGLLVDGWRDGQPVDDEAYTPASPNLGIENLYSNANFDSEVVGFGSGRSVTVVPVTWTDEPSDRVEFELAPAYELPVTVWMVYGDPVEQHERMQAWFASVNDVLESERAGIRFAGSEMRLGPTDPAPTLDDVNCGDRPLLEQTVGRIPGRINVYLVHRVYGDLEGVTACTRGGFVALAEGGKRSDLAHGLVANFGLEYIAQLDPVFTFDDQNLMSSKHGERLYLSEGQVFRMHLDPASALNSVYEARDGLRVRECPARGSRLCPVLDRRLWADGVLGGG